MLNYKKMLVVLSSVILMFNITGCSDTTDILETPDLSGTPAIESPAIDEEEIHDNADLSNEVIDENNFGVFSSTTLKGDEISSDVFADYEVTMVNIWATWCAPCVREMPYLQELYSMLPGKANLITICSDATTDEELANAILDDSNAEFETIIANDEVNSVVLSRIQAFPTSVFVDKEGTVIHVVQGVPSGDDVATQYLEIIELILEMIDSDAS